MVNWDVTFTIHGATGIGDYYPFNDKTDPFAGIFVDDRQIGLTPTRSDDHNPKWNTRIRTSVDQSELSSGSDCTTWRWADPCPMICIALFDRDRFDDSEHYRSTFDGASLDQMKAQNTFLASKCDDGGRVERSRTGAWW